MKEVLGTSKSPATPSANGIIRFGNFEVDPSAGELRRGGLRIKLGGQPFDVLFTLLQKPGQVVTREELHDKLWAQDTFVDFEHGLNKAINKVRDALGDDADNPRFVETIPRRGYRFLVPLAQPAPEAPPSIATAANPTEEPAPAVVAPVRSQRQRWIWIAALALAATVLVAVVLSSRPAQPPKVLRYTQLTNDGLKKSATVTAALATDGSSIYFGEQDGQQGLIAQVSVTGGNVSTVARFQNPNVSAVDYSPTRSELLINFGLGTPLLALSIPGGSAPRRIGDSIADAAWSLDGQSIVYGGVNELSIMRADGSEPRKLATVQGAALYPRWSPDGKALRFTLNSFDSGRTSIWEIAADGTNLHPTFPDWHARNDYGGSWTSDGKYFVYTSFLPNGHGSIFATREKKGLFERGTAQRGTDDRPHELFRPAHQQGRQENLHYGVPGPRRTHALRPQ
jgi:DNA-binding winged helix-turn-helix (wHTH) protein